MPSSRVPNLFQTCQFVEVPLLMESMDICWSTLGHSQVGDLFQPFLMYDNSYKYICLSQKLDIN